MLRFTDAGQSCLLSKNWYAALTLALTLPDICASLEDPGPGKSRERYLNWCRRWLEPKYVFRANTLEEKILFTAENIYQARNSIIHSGTSEILASRKNEFDRFEFFSESGNHLNVIDVDFYGEHHRFLQLQVDMFCNEVFEAVLAWDVENAGNPSVQAEKAKLLVIHSPGTIIAGMQFGMPPAPPSGAA